MKKLTILFFLAIMLSCTQSASWYYDKAMAASDQGDAPQALSYLRKAADCVETDSMRAVIYSEMGHLLFDEGLQEQAMQSFVKAYDADKHLCDTASMIYDLCDIANVWRTREDDDSCVCFFSQAIALAELQGNSMSANVVRSQLAGYYLWNGNVSEAYKHLAPVLADTLLRDDAGVVFMFADYYRQTNQNDSAQHYCMKLLEDTETGHRQMGHKWLAEILLEEGQVKEAMGHLKEYELLTDSLMEEVDTEAMRRVNALYDYTSREKENTHLRYRYAAALAGIVVLTCILAILLLYHRYRRMQYKLKIQKLEYLLAQNSDHGKERLEKAHQILAKTPIYNHINRLLNDTQPKPMTDEDWHILEDTIEKVYPGFSRRLNDFRKLSSQEMRISLLIKMGVNPIGIARLTSHSKQSVSSTRSRLFLKVFGKKGTPAQWDQFILSL